MNTNDGRIINPEDRSADEEREIRHGDSGDQGNDLRFAEEQQLIQEQAERRAADPAEAVAAARAEGSYTSHPTTKDQRGYTGEQDPLEEGEYTDKDKQLIDAPEGEGEYTDRDR